MLRDIFYNYFPDLLGGLYFRLGINLVPESKYPIDIDGVKKVCILATSGIGNLIMLTPMIRSLRRGLPGARITVVVSPNGAKDVIEGSDLVDEVLVLDSKRTLKEIRDDWPDLTIAATHRGFIRAKRAFRTGAMYRLGFRYDHEDKLDIGLLFTHTVALDESKHEVEQGLDFIRALRLPEIRELYMHIEDEDRAIAGRILHDTGVQEGDLLVGIHAGLGADDPKGRCWPMDRFARLGDILIGDYGAELIMVGGSAEVSVANRIASIMQNKPIILAGKTTLRQTAAVIEKCQLFISNDGGPMHIAAAVGTPVIGIFGPTDSARYGPYGENCSVVKSDLPCSPCHEPHSPEIECQNLDCLEAISVDMVMEAASPRLHQVVSNG
jgi:ADP-heptose:LPS heptosyltransferase